MKTRLLEETRSTFWCKTKWFATVFPSLVPDAVSSLYVHSGLCVFLACE